MLELTPVVPTPAARTTAMAAPIIFLIIYILGSFRVIVSIDPHFLKLGTL